MLKKYLNSALSFLTKSFQYIQAISFSIYQDIYSERRIYESYSETSKAVNVDEKDEMIQALQYQLEKQKRKQLRQERVCTCMLFSL